MTNFVLPVHIKQILLLEVLNWVLLLALPSERPCYMLAEDPRNLPPRAIGVELGTARTSYIVMKSHKGNAPCTKMMLIEVRKALPDASWWSAKSSLDTSTGSQVRLKARQRLTKVL